MALLGMTAGCRPWNRPGTTLRDSFAWSRILFFDSPLSLNKLDFKSRGGSIMKWMPGLARHLAGGLALSLAMAALSPGLAGERGPVRSFLEMRRDKVVVQEWDLSCGAAALATILNYQHGDPVSEKEIASGLINREEYLANPLLVQAREGFSLLDLKRYVDDRGYEGVGYGQLTLDHLIERAPIMVPVNFNDYNHFVVFRGVRGNRVLLADPAFGNRTMLIEKFEDGWIDYPDFGRVGFVVTRPDGAAPPNRLIPRAGDFVMLR